MNIFKNTLATIISIMLSFILATPAQVVNAQAYCDLRDPNKGIYEMFPEATNYRSIVKLIDKSVKQKVEQRLPPQSLHFSELGKHTLYVPTKDGEVLGYLHVRSEESRWGLVEIAWAMDTDLNIVDYKFQRCRTGKKKLLQDDMFKQQIIGKNFKTLLPLLKPGTSDIDTNKISIPKNAEELANTLLRCGLKTTLITEIAWKKEIEKITFQYKAERTYDDFASIKMISDPFSTNVVEKLEQLLSGGLGNSNTHQSKVAHVLDKNDSLVGAIYRQSTSLEGVKTDLWWTFDADRTVLAVENASGWQNKQDEEVFNAITGKQFSDSAKCSNRVELMALEAVIIAGLAL